MNGPDTPEIARAFNGATGRDFMARLFAIPPFAHHPDCGCYDAHVLRFGKLVLCLGCFCVGAGAVLASLSILLLSGEWLVAGRGWWGSAWFLCSGVILYAPSLIQPFLQHKAFTLASRSSLGAAIVLLLVGGLFLPPLDAVGFIARGLFLVVFRGVYRATLRFRERFTPDPCLRCGNAVYPFCKDNRPRLVALLEALRRRAGPEDVAIVAFATALAAETPSANEVEVEILSLRPSGEADSPSCHRRSKVP
jgi:hypothetical protein